MNNVEFKLTTEEQMENFSACLADVIKAPCCIYLQGDLGAGKTTLCRGFIRAKGHSGAVKSPTYTLLETYELNDVCIHHMDCYRIADPEELEYIGIRDISGGESTVFLIEWPQLAEGFLPLADMTINITYEEVGRRLTLDSDNTSLLDEIKLNWQNSVKDL